MTDTKRKLRAWRAPDYLIQRFDREAHKLYEEGYRAGLRTADDFPGDSLRAIEDDLCRHEISTSPDPTADLVERFNTGRRTIMLWQPVIDAALAMTEPGCYTQDSHDDARREFSDAVNTYRKAVGK